MTEKRFTKSNLPEKICAACARPFAWRKKWARDWDNVKTCSERCKGDLRRKNARLCHVSKLPQPNITRGFDA